MTRVVSIGECMVETSDAQAPRFAGDTFNTAWYLAQLAPGWAVDYLTGVGDDAASDDLLAFAAASGVGTQHMTRHTGRSLGNYRIELADGERSFHYDRDTSAARLLASDEERLTEGLTRSDIVFFSGITLAILTEDEREVLFDAISDAQANGAVVVFDPNIRDQLWPDLEDMRAAVMEAALSSEVILPSFDEEAKHFGDADPQATVKRYLTAGATSVVVKNGGGPIHYSVGGVEGVVTPTMVSAVDTTAAGDSFNAGFLAALMSGGNPEEAVNAACDLSSRVVQGHGALVDGAVTA